MDIRKRIAFGITVAIFAITWIAPIWPLEQALHSSLTVVGLIWLVLHDRRWPMRNADFIAICGFIVVHCIAARWLYSNVPYDAWLRASIGWSPQAAFGWERNHFDRFVHFLWGFLLTLPIFEILRKKVSRKLWAIFIFACCVIVLVGVLYEFMEWAAAVVVAPEAGTAFLGTQGDIWDAQKDLLMNLLGALAAVIWLPFRRKH